MTRHFFFYGTLRHDIAQGVPAGLIEGLEVVGPASVAGAIYARRDPRGTYPVLLLGGRGRVQGIICRAGDAFTARNLAAMDRYEGAAGTGGEYVRRPVRAQLQGGTRVMAEAYLYNRGLSADLAPIRHGDFARYIAETGHRPYLG